MQNRINEMSKPGDSESKLDGGAGVNNGLMQAGFTGQTAGGTSMMNSSSIEQQLDLKYKAYSSMMQNNMPGAGQKAAGATPGGMLPNTS